MKPREFWISQMRWMTNPPKVAVIDEQPQSKDEFDGPWIHVREVLPGTVTLTREEFRALWDKSTLGDPYIIAMEFRKDLEAKLFGDEK